MHNFNLKKSVGKAFIFSFVTALIFSFQAMAQELPDQQEQQQQQQIETDISEQELEQFVEVYVKANEIQKENEAQMIQAIEEEDLDVNRFNEILMSRQNQESPEEVNASAEELASFNQAAEKIMEVQQQAQTEIEQLIEEEMGTQKYQAIVIAYQQDPEVQQKVNKMLEQKME